MGFVNYDEIFDYSFDTEPDLHIRYEKIIENVKRLSVLSREELTELYKKLWPKVIHNKRVAMDYVNDLPKEVLPFLDMLKNQGEYTGPLNMFL
jgi:hypothetical protein